MRDVGSLFNLMKKAPGKHPTKMNPFQYQRSLTQNSDKVIYSDKQIKEFRIFEKKNNVGKEIPSLMELTITQNYIPVLNYEAEDDLFGFIQSCILPFPLSRRTIRLPSRAFP